MNRLETLHVLLGDLRVTPRFPASRGAVLAGPEEAEIPGERDSSSAWSAFIVYRDASGARSERRITCHQISGFGSAELVKSYCHERRAIRSFRIDRIEELVCAESGEVLEPQPHFEALRVRGALTVDDQALTDLTRVLVFLGRCDGEYHPLEERRLEDLLGRYVLRFGGDDRLLEAAVRNAGRLAPDGTDVVHALGKFARAANGPALSRFLLDSSGQMIDADGRHSTQEIAWAIELGEALKVIADRRD